MTKIGTAILALSMLLFVNAFAGADEDLLKACQQGDLAGANVAIAAGADVNKPDANGNPPLASAFFWADITKLLIDKGADPNAGNYPALISACNNYSIDVVKILLDAGADPNKPGISDPGATFRKLIEAEKAKGKQANQTIIKTYEDMLAKTPKTEVELVRIIVQQTNCVPCLKLALEKGGKVEFKDGTNALETFAGFSMTREERKNAFKAGASGMEAYGLKVPDWYLNLPDNVNGEPIEILDLILSKGIDINKPFSNGLTALTTALRSNGKLPAAKALVAKGADPKIAGTQTVGSTKITHYPICHAAQLGDTELMEKLLAGGADINSNATTNSLMNADGSWGGDGYTPLILAIKTKNYDVARLLINNGADLKIGTNGYAVWETSFENLKCLVSVKNKTPIYWAVEHDNMEIITLLAEKMLWKFNPDFSYDVISNASSTEYNIGCKKGKSKLSPSSYSGEVGNKAAASYLSSKGM